MSQTYMAVAVVVVLNLSCVATFQKAKISKIDENLAGSINGQKLVYQYRIHGLQQMWIYVVPEENSLSTQKNQNVFTQLELSKLKFKVVSLNGKLSVNGLKIEQGKTLQINLKKTYNMYGEGGVKDIGKYASVIRFVNYKNVPPDENLCDFILTIEDPEGITRTTGLRVHGGFTDSL